MLQKPTVLKMDAKRRSRRTPQQALVGLHFQKPWALQPCIKEVCTLGRCKGAKTNGFEHGGEKALEEDTSASACWPPFSKTVGFATLRRAGVHTSASACGRNSASACGRNSASAQTHKHQHTCTHMQTHTHTPHVRMCTCLNARVRVFERVCV